MRLSKYELGFSFDYFLYKFSVFKEGFDFVDK